MKSSTRGWLNGFTGMLIFSGSLPATRLAVTGFEPVFLTAARAGLAGLIALALLLAIRVPRPARVDRVPLLIVAAGVVVGFPLFTALALREVTSAHAIVFIALLPLITSVFGVLRAGERPRPAYVTGGQVICWALVVSLPLMLVLAAASWPPNVADIAWPAWAGLAYVSLFSMLIGFVFWYRGLALGGIAAVSQLQLLQPFLGLLLAAMLLGESVQTGMLATAALVVVCVAGARRMA